MNTVTKTKDELDLIRSGWKISYRTILIWPDMKLFNIPKTKGTVEMHCSKHGLPTGSQLHCCCQGIKSSLTVTVIYV